MKAILPDRTAGLGVGVAVGLGVGVGPLLVGVGVAVLVGVAGADVALAVGGGVAVVVDRTIGVHVGVGVFIDVVGMVSGTGIMSTWPGRINAGLVMPLASANACGLKPKRAAISDNVSPALTV